MPWYSFAPPGTPAANFRSSRTIFDAAHPPAQLADDIDPATGDIRSLFTSVRPVTAAAQHNLTVKRGSGAAVQDRGQRFGDITKNDESTETEIRNEVARIFAPFVAARLVEVTRVDVEIGVIGDPTESAMVIDFRELVTGAAQSVGVPL